MREESSKQELKMKEVDTRIEQEIANLKTNIQASKATTLQYLVGFGMSIFVLFFFFGGDDGFSDRILFQSPVALPFSWPT